MRERRHGPSPPIATAPSPIVATITPITGPNHDHRDDPAANGGAGGGPIGGVGGWTTLSFTWLGNRTF